MANTRSAEKQQRQAEKANTRNRAGKTRLRSNLKTARTKISDGSPDASVLSTSFSQIDKAAKKGLIKENTANRYKSRLAKAVKKTEAK
jgi:small subunit ribosomal protein S20